MNEAQNFCNGACYETQVPPTPVLSNAPYWPTGRSLNIDSLSTDALHFSGFSELYEHNMWAYGEVRDTNLYFQSLSKRPAIISRSSFAGQGFFGSKWLGDNHSTAQDMGLSVEGVMMMNMFGIPVVGADVCGFLGDTTPELCARWTRLAAFYPFARNHNDINSKSQEPYDPMFNVKDPATGKTYSELIKDAIKMRYNFIPYLYSHIHDMFHHGGAYFKPLFDVCPNDFNCYKDIESNFMLGNGLKVGMVTNKVGVTEGTFYFPSGAWCPLGDFETDCINNVKYVDGDTPQALPGTSEPMSATAADAHVHIAQQHIVPMVDAFARDTLKVADIARLNTDLHISPGPIAELSW